MATVTILIPTYQEGQFIRECIESVKAFDDPTRALIQVLILDGMSTDGTREIVEELALGDRRILLIDNPRRLLWQHLHGDVAGGILLDPAYDAAGRLDSIAIPGGLLDHNYYSLLHPAGGAPGRRDSRRSTARWP